MSSGVPALRLPPAAAPRAADDENLIFDELLESMLHDENFDFGLDTDLDIFDTHSALETTFPAAEGWQPAGSVLPDSPLSLQVRASIYNPHPTILSASSDQNAYLWHSGSACTHVIRSVWSLGSLG